MVRKCQATRINGKQCNNKALNTSRVCHLHHATRHVKKPEKNCLLFHIHFLYGLMKFGDQDFLKLDNPNARGCWQHISDHIFDQKVSNLAVQSHANRYFKWMRKNNLNSREDVVSAMTKDTKNVNRGKYAVFLPHMHMFLRFNQYTIGDMIHYFTVVMVNDIPYRMTVDRPVRVDEAFRNYSIADTFSVLQALDGYHINNKGLAVRSSPGCSELQQRCLSSLGLGAPTRPCNDMPLVAMDLESYRCLVATCVDALDQSNSPWQGSAPLVVDVCSLIRNHTIKFPCVSEEGLSQTSFTNLLNDDYPVQEYCFGDMPQVVDLDAPQCSQVASPQCSQVESPQCSQVASPPCSQVASPPDVPEHKVPIAHATDVLKTPVTHNYLTAPRVMRYRFSSSLQSLATSIHKRRVGLYHMRQRVAKPLARLNNVLNGMRNPRYQTAQ